jgi:hypothetical protein
MIKILISVLLLAAGGILCFLNQQRKTLYSIDEIELKGVYFRWEDAGRPENDALTQFLKGRRNDLIVETQKFTINKTNFDGFLALTNTYGGRKLIITRQGQLFREPTGSQRNP